MEGMKSLNEGDVLFAAKKFNEAELLYPQSEWAAKAVLMASYGYYSQAYYSSAADELNESNPYLIFNTSDIQTVIGDETVAKNALDLIKVVPNPYYGSSKYERDQVDHRVKITNLPKTCTISIYNVSGTLVRQVSLDSDQNVTGWDWDLKNNYNVAISSGVYIIHIDAGEIGEKVLKWFGALRPIDLDSF